MNNKEAKQEIIKTNRLRKESRRLLDRIWRTNFTSSDFALLQKKLRAVNESLSEGRANHLSAIKVLLSPDNN